MNRHFRIAAISIGVSLLAGSCSELKEDLPSPVAGGVAVHSAGWQEEHGEYLEENGYNTRECQTCHGGNFQGGTSGVSCSGCHSSYPHPDGWTGTHGSFLKNIAYDATACRTCHGDTYQGGTSGVSCYSCHASYPHVAEWTTGGAATSHGLYLKGKSWVSSECQPCHGTSYQGGTSGIACFTCHASYPHAVGFAAAGGHVSYMYANHYPLNDCKVCHGSAYSGGNVGASESCVQPGCHVDRNGVAKSPEACNTCHGDFGAPSLDALSAAPPKSVLGETATSVRGVGAHAKHLVSGTLGRAVKCQECHAVPGSLLAPGHIDVPYQVQVAMNDTLARLVTRDGLLRPAPAYTGTTCANAYCHGNWVLRRATAASTLGFADSIMSGGNFAPVWTGGAPQAACGTCHGLPPVGHQIFPGTTCSTCHGDVVDVSNAIIDKTKHINGKVNLGPGNPEYPMH